MMRATLLTTLLLATCLPVRAQDPVTYRLTAFGSGPLKSASYASTPAGEYVRVSKMHVTNPIEGVLREGTFLDLFAEGAGAEDPPAFTVRIPSPASDLLVVLMHSGEGIKPILLDLKSLNLQGGGQYFFNLLPVAIAVQCGEEAKPLTIPAGKTRNISAPAADKVIQTLYYADANGKPAKFSSSIFFKDREMRQIVFCYNEPGAKLPKVAPISIYDRRKPEPVE